MEQQVTTQNESPLEKHSDFELSVTPDVAKKHGMNSREWALHEANMKKVFLMLRGAYPQQSRKFSEMEYKLMVAVWAERFAGVKESHFHEAINQHVDTKPLFPVICEILGACKKMQALQDKRDADVQRDLKEIRDIEKVRDRLIMS